MNHFLKKQYLFAVVLIIFLLIFFKVHGPIDLMLISPWLTTHGQFFLRGDWALATLSHQYVKYILIGVLTAFFVYFIRSFISTDYRERRFEYGYLFFTMISSTILIGLVKAHSDYACPWDMTVPNANGFNWNFNLKNGHCFPGGHASTGFALFAGYFYYRFKNQSLAYFYLISALILGMGMGWAQMMRGAHFISHNLWTGAFMWIFNLCIFTLVNLKFPAKFIKQHTGANHMETGGQFILYEKAQK